MKSSDFKKLKVVGNRFVEKTNKMKNQIVTWDGLKFRSKKEKERYQILKVLEKYGKIKNLRLQTRWPLKANGILVCEYWSDFDYNEMPGGKFIIEDTKGKKTDVYRIKKNLMKALYQVDIFET